MLEQCVILLLLIALLKRHVMDKLIIIQLIEEKNSSIFFVREIRHFFPVNPTSLRILGIISADRKRIPPSSIKYHRNVLLLWHLEATNFYVKCFKKHTLCFPRAHFVGDVSISFLEIRDLTRLNNLSS